MIQAAIIAMTPYRWEYKFTVHFPLRQASGKLLLGSILALVCILFVRPHGSWAQAPAPTGGDRGFASFAAAAEAQRQEGESMYAGTVGAPPYPAKTISLLVERVLPSDGKSVASSPPRISFVRLADDTTFVTADATKLSATIADVTPGAHIFVIGPSSPATGPRREIVAREVFVAVDGGDTVASNLIHPWSATSNWTARFNGGSAPGSKLANEGNALLIHVGGHPEREWQAQIYQQLADLVPGSVYTLRFRARADTRHFLTVGTEVDQNAPYVNTGLLETALLTTRWQVFQYTFTSRPGHAGPFRAPVFSAGYRGGDVYLANIALVPGALPLPPSLEARHTQARIPNENLMPDANDADSWLLFAAEGARGRIEQDLVPGGGPVLKITVQEASTEFWHLQVLRPGIPLEEGRTYQLQFLARSDRPRTMDLRAQAGNGDFHDIGLTETVTLGADWKPYTIRFKTHDTVPDHNRVPQFCLGTTAGIVYLSNISLTLLP